MDDDAILAQHSLGLSQRAIQVVEQVEYAKPHDGRAGGIVERQLRGTRLHDGRVWVLLAKTTTGVRGRFGMGPATPSRAQPSSQLPAARPDLDQAPVARQ